ncbi:MAG TPA: hypothetical protein VM889_04710 [Candidatus Thermoplasmatota archaeon]|nr:hypothetical protein [Candidatus Thermoplasmatota archaeon]
MLRAIIVALVAVVAGCASPSASHDAEEESRAATGWPVNLTRLLVVEPLQGPIEPDRETVVRGNAPALDVANRTVRDVPPFAHRPMLAVEFAGEGVAATGSHAFLMRAGEYVVRAVSDENATWIHVGWLWEGPDCRVSVVRGAAKPTNTTREEFVRLATNETAVVEIVPPASDARCPRVAFRATDRGVWTWASEPR